MNVKDNMQNFDINQALKYIEGKPEENLPKLMSLVDRFTPEGWYQSQRDAIRRAIEEKSNWYQLILRIYELDPGVRRAFFQNFLFNASLKGSATQNEVKARENCNVPWAILLDPTSTCNMAPAAGRRSTETSLISAWRPSILSSVRARNWVPTCIFTPAASRWYGKRILAERFLGSGAQWSVLYELNKTAIEQAAKQVGNFSSQDGAPSRRKSKTS